jgi:hypothetical protein
MAADLLRPIVSHTYSLYMSLYGTIKFNHHGQNSSFSLGGGQANASDKKKKLLLQLNTEPASITGLYVNDDPAPVITIEGKY